jgi:cell division cycle 20-like protein 1 (cofactor of APC complex)
VTSSPGGLFSYRSPSRPSSAPSYAGLFKDMDSDSLLDGPRRTVRKISRVPFKVLDAPMLQDDFYLNLVDWSAQNVLAVGLDTCVYLWSAYTSVVTKLCDVGSQNSITSVAWLRKGSLLAVGTNEGVVQVWDVAALKRVRSFTGHTARVGTLAASRQLLSSGSRDRTILHRDMRASEQFVEKLVGHRQEVCGLKWSHNELLLASGGNDNKLCVWSQGSTTPLLKFSEHTAAVKALAWSPHQHGLLASGGGTADRCIRIWNTTLAASLAGAHPNTGTSPDLSSSNLCTVDTGSQVCNLAWSKSVNELVSTHGYSQNQIALWKYPSMTPLATLTGHSLRVLYLATSPDGQTIVTGAGDETLRFYNVWPPAKGTASKPGIFESNLSNIR